MAITPPDASELAALLGAGAYDTWRQISEFITLQYAPQILWASGNKAGVWECKFRRGGKTLCALYAREGHFGFLIILGAQQRDAFEQQRAVFAPEIAYLYDKTKTYHDGKWLMIEVRDGTLLEQLQWLLAMKRKPPQKQ